MLKLVKLRSLVAKCCKIRKICNFTKRGSKFSLSGEFSMSSTEYYEMIASDTF